MALVSGGRSTLNPNAPLFIPSYVQQVEDFSPEWWNLFEEFLQSSESGQQEIKSSLFGVNGFPQGLLRHS
ncbi:hypothetical protein HAX54_040539 [Datura stramonium]|uniref:Uncharacterized protein n=1 Tax=Datura stramonium TaxID=4076 RepID=A0ABS8SKG0_DATST|nr:hypothetical protein [Datura stramonium]